MPYSMEEFAAQIKAKFPAYADWPTDHLVTEVVAKHPEYASWVTLDPRTAIAVRGANPPAAAKGDPNAGRNDVTAGDVAGAAVKGVAHLVGAPTSLAEVPGAVKDLALNAGTMGAYGATKAVGQVAEDVSAPARAYAAGYAPTAEQNAGAVPIIGKPVQAVDNLAETVARGNAPTRGENLRAVEAGTSLAGMAAMQHPVAAETLSRAGAALEGSGTSTYADALAARGTENRPLAESLGSQLAGDGKVMTNPKKQLGTAFGGTQDITFKFDKASNSLKDLQAKYPDDTITEDGQSYTLHQSNEGQPNQQAANELAKDMPTPEAQAWWMKAGKYLIPGGIGFKLGGPVGAAIAEAPIVVAKVVQSPLWKTTSGVVKTSLGRALQAGDMATVTNIAAKVLGGVNLEDAYGHDQALYDLHQSLPQNDPKALHQALQDHQAVYMNQDGTSVAVPFNVQKQTYDAISGQH
jgi:hypothetical protein